MYQRLSGGRRTVSVLAAALVAVTLLGACSSGDDDDTATNDTPSEGSGGDGGGQGEGGSGGEGGEGGGLGAAAQAARNSLNGVWEGSYECAQGVTGLTLTIDDRGNGDLGAAFEYHPTDDNPSVATGIYSMTGTKTDAAMQLEGHEWIEQGGDYGMVALTAPLEGREDTESLTGTVEGAGCTEFTAERVSTDPWYVGTWQGAYGCNQGVTGLTLTIDASASGELTAVYEFYEVPENPGVPSGSFRMTGTYNEGQISLQGDEWLDQPEGYGMVDYESNPALGIDPNRLFGTVLGQGCTLFTMEKTDDGTAAVDESGGAAGS
jgi:hypothetical protein